MARRVVITAGAIVSDKDAPPPHKEIAVVNDNRAAILRHFREDPPPACADRWCLRCADRYSTYSLCDVCRGLVKNYFEEGILKRTDYMLEQKDAEKRRADEMSKCTALFQTLTSPQRVKL